MNQTNRLLSTMLVFFAVSGCVGPAEYERVASQGVDFQDAYLAYVKYVNELAVQSRTLDMATVLTQQEPGQDRLNTFDNYMTGIRGSQPIFKTVREHGSAMRAYFRQLQSLATSDAAKESKAAISETVASINSLSGRFGDFGISSEQSTITGGLVAAGVSIQQRKLLSEELSENGELIEANILLQIAALKRLETDAVRHLETVQAANLIYLQDTVERASPMDTRRVAQLASDSIMIETTELKSASAAATELLGSWRDLVRRAKGDMTLEELYASLKDLSTEIQKMEATTDAIKALL